MVVARSRFEEAEEAVAAPESALDSILRVGLARRALDVGLSALGLMLFSPLFVVITILVSLTSRGSPLFRQTRVGEGWREFTMFKFRSMRRGLAGSDLTVRDDDRVTRLGRILRLTGIDELPQLWNVLRGDMTLVGPRPETVGLALRYPADCRGIFRYRPGLTGPTQLATWNREDHERDASAEQHYLEARVPGRVTLDMNYLVDPSLKRTLGVLARTAFLALASTGRLFGAKRTRRVRRRDLRKT
jgi:lipopolysaccharide/colanic/teichoic acid biosynthesis glycosyltransferase